MSEAKAAPVIKEEPRMSTKKEQAGHALGDQIVTSCPLS